MNELIKVLDYEGKKAISLRELYLFLGLNISQYSRWYKTNILDNQFAVDGVDYDGFDMMSNGNPVREFAISIDFAKKIAMMAKTEKGEQARNYFIEVEKQLNKPLSEIEILQRSITLLVQQQKELKQIESRVEKLEVKSIGSGELQHFSILAFCNNIHKQISLNEAKDYGQKCSRMCTQMGFQTGKVPDPRFGTVKTYPLSVLESIIK